MAEIPQPDKLLKHHFKVLMDEVGGIRGEDDFKVLDGRQVRIFTPLARIDDADRTLHPDDESYDAVYFAAIAGIRNSLMSATRVSLDPKNYMEKFESLWDTTAKPAKPNIIRTIVSRDTQEKLGLTAVSNTDLGDILDDLRFRRHQQQHS